MPKTAEQIVVRFPNWVGDIVMATPFLHCLREGRPDATIHVVVRRYAAGILEDCPWIDQIVGIDDRTPAGLWRTARTVRALGASEGWLLPHSTRSFLGFHLAGIKRIYGYRQRLHRALLSDGPVPVRQKGKPVPEPMQDHYLRLCTHLGLPVPDGVRPRLFIGAELEGAGAAYLGELGIVGTDCVVGLNPGAKFGSSKCWAPESFALAADLLVERLGCRVLLLVGPGEEGIADAIEAAAHVPVINTARRIAPLDLLKPVVKRCNLLITNDTGPRHYAVAFAVPTVVIMGPTDPRYTAANLQTTTVIRRELPCSPCHLKVCPREHECMTGIAPAEVAEAAMGLLGGEG